MNSRMFSRCKGFSIELKHDFLPQSSRTSAFPIGRTCAIHQRKPVFRIRHSSPRMLQIPSSRTRMNRTVLAFGSTKITVPSRMGSSVGPSEAGCRPSRFRASWILSEGEEAERLSSSISSCSRKWWAGNRAEIDD